MAQSRTSPSISLLIPITLGILIFGAICILGYLFLSFGQSMANAQKAVPSQSPIQIQPTTIP